MLPLLLSGLFILGWRIGVFFFLGALFGSLMGVLGARFGGGDEGVDCEDEEEGVDGTFVVLASGLVRKR